MPKIDNLTETLLPAVEIDFVSQFGGGMGRLLDILSVERRIEMPIGSTIKTYTSKVTLDGTKVGKGEIIPLSKVEMTEGEKLELEWDKKRKEVTAEDIQKYGRETAVVRTDNLLKRKCQGELKAKLYKQLGEGTTKITVDSLQGALAQGWGNMLTKFEDDDITTVAFVNALDIATYLEGKEITLQKEFGMTYLTNFLGIDIVIVANAVPKGTVYTTVADNLVLAYANMGSKELSDFGMTTDETGIIGITHSTETNRLAIDTIVANAMLLYAERLDGIVVATITPKKSK